ncbi:hypothetical protein F8203_gp052 [Heliothis virescens ascovirus 3f]|uniref:Uncharacterized protein n=1 Tax=Heliothis virescens ascovirus 3f TaxID=328614 RepID=A0A171PVD0_9VIRU|nr:hypothetical protein F8203_gp052 [Heliothis virescens ascovirus 3f]AJP09018.1 hypothetical protein [Heliothis virescens ascovirus 3f]
MSGSTAAISYPRLPSDSGVAVTTSPTVIDDLDLRIRNALVALSNSSVNSNNEPNYTNRYNNLSWLFARNENRDPARATHYDPYRDGYYMYALPNGRVDRSLWRFLKPNFWFSRLMPSRESYCKRCCSYRDYFMSSKYKDDPRFDNFQCNKASCGTIPGARACGAPSAPWDVLPSVNFNANNRQLMGPSMYPNQPLA